MLVDLSMFGDSILQKQKTSQRRQSTISSQSSSSPTARNFPFARFTYEHRARSIDSDNIIGWEPNSEARELIKLTWTDNLDFLFDLGVKIFDYIFTHVPECKSLFPSIHKHGEAYRESREFRSQTLKFAQTISHCVQNIYRIDDVAAYLAKIGEQHCRFAERGFTPDLWDVFLDAMEVALIDQISTVAPDLDVQRQEAAAHVWRRLTFFIITHMKHGYFLGLEKLPHHHPKHTTD
ncbi:Globin [Aphelenchoides besseyi]|nr:Globin [Aphelenchoides besseyi]